MGGFCPLVELHREGSAPAAFAAGLLILIQPFPPTALRRRHAQTVRDSSSSYKIDYVIVIKNFLNLEGHQHPIIGSKVTAILLKGWTSPIGGASAVKGLRSTGLPPLVFFTYHTTFKMS